MIAVVIDPHETKASGKIDLGSFRCYPEVVLYSHRYFYVKVSYSILILILLFHFRNIFQPILKIMLM